MPTVRAAAATVSMSDDNLAVLGPGEAVFPQGHEADMRVAAVIIQADETVCLVCGDAMTLPNEVLAGILRRVTAATALTAEQILLTATHTHHAPCTIDFLGCRPNREFLRRLEEAAVRAVIQAWQQLQDPATPALDLQAEILLGRSQEATVGRNSRLLLQDGQIGWFGYQEADAVRPTGPYDPDLMVLALRRPRGQWAALIFNHSVHNIGAWQQGRLSPGFYGLTAQGLEQVHGTVALFLPGAFGSTHNITYEGSGVPTAECVTRMTAAIEEALGRLEPALGGAVRALKRPFTYRLRHFDETVEAEKVRRYFSRYATEHAAGMERVFGEMRVEMAPVQGEARETVLQVIRLGEVALVGIPGEFYARLGLEIRRRSPFRHTYVVGLANEEIGYIPDRQAYEDGGYQTWVGWHCRCAPGTGEAMVEQALEMLREVAGEPELVEPPRVRPLRDGDGPALQRFYNHLGTEARWLFAPLGWQAGLPDTVSLCQASGGAERYDVVLDNGREIVGWAFVNRLDTPRAHLGIGIADGYTSRGLGGALMQAVCDEARRRGKEAIDLIVVTGNERARKLYERFGFAVTGEFTSENGVDFLNMVAVLQPGRNGSH